jgi:hypothetical protein
LPYLEELGWGLRANRGKLVTDAGGFLVAWLSLNCLPRRFTEVESSPLGRASWLPGAAFAAGESGPTVFFLLAIRHISAAEANLLIFLWPPVRQHAT